MCLVHISTHYIARDTTIILCNSAGGNEEQQDRNPFTNEAQSRETNFATRQDPSLHDDDDYDSLESVHENSKTITHTHTHTHMPGFSPAQSLRVVVLAIKEKVLPEKS